MDNCFLSPLNHGEMGFLDPTAFDLDVLSLPATINTSITTATNTNNINTTTMTSASSSMDTILNPNHHLDGFIPQQLVQLPQQPQELVHSNGLVAYPCPFNVDMDPSQWGQGAQMDTSSTAPQTNALIPVNTDARSSVNDQTSFSASGGPMVMTPSATSTTATSSPSSLHELAACSPAIAALLPLLVSNPQAKSVLPNLAASIGKPPVKPKVSQQALSQKVQEILGLTGINTGNGTGMTVTPASAVPPIKIIKSTKSRAGKNTKAKRTSRRSSSPSSSYSSSRERENESSSPCPSSPNSDVYPALSPLSPSSSESGSTSPVHSLSPTADSTSATSTDTLVPVSLGDLLLSMETKQKRLARKAELARMSRKRKATRMGDLEAEVDRLQKEIATLKKQKQARVNAANLDGDEHDSNRMNAHENVHSKMNVEDDSDVKLVYNALEEIITAYHSPLVKQENPDVDSDVDEEDENSSSHSRQLHRAVETFVAAHTHSMNATEKHLTALASHTQPILPLQFLQWICSQNDKFYEAPNSLWRSLFVGELNTSDEQMRDLLALKTTVRKQSKLLYDIEKAYKKLSTAMKKQLSQRVENLEKVRSILTTQQLAKYLEWTNKYGQVCLKINTNSQE